MTREVIHVAGDQWSRSSVPPGPEAFSSVSASLVSVLRRGANLSYTCLGEQEVVSTGDICIQSRREDGIMTALCMETSPLYHGVLTIPSLGNDQNTNLPRLLYGTTSHDSPRTCDSCVPLSLF